MMIIQFLEKDIDMPDQLQISLLKDKMHDRYRLSVETFQAAEELFRFCIRQDTKHGGKADKKTILRGRNTFKKAL